MSDDKDEELLEEIAQLYDASLHAMVLFEQCAGYLNPQG